MAISLTRALKARAAHCPRCLWLICAVLSAGCSTARQVEVEQLRLNEMRGAIVSTLDGYTYSFSSVQVEGDNLIGTYQVVEEQINESGHIAFVDADQYIALPLTQIERVEVKRIDYGNTLLLGAGATLLVIWASSLSEDTQDDRPKTHYGPGNKGGGGGLSP
ncbi:MAG: hypothetical protein KAY24_13965 [Candidatus Eisenbacteria sp.]|nr:hypothetical protein [Candidatus Eisenbacteria bacterium]